jgi:hypothetical protein
MKSNFRQINGAIKKSLRFLFFAILFQASIYSQTISNLDVFYNMVDSASGFLLKDLGDIKTVNLELNLGNDYSLFANQIRGKLLKNGVQLTGDNSWNHIITGFDKHLYRIKSF